MDDSNVSDLPSFPGYGSRLMSESPLPRGTSLDNRDNIEADLSLSELSVAEPPRRLERFSLLAPRQQDSLRLEEGDSLFSEVAEEAELGEENEESDEDDEDNTVKREQDQRAAAQSREEKLRSDIFVLRKLNSAFGSFDEALQETTSANQVRRIHALYMVDLTALVENCNPISEYRRVIEQVHRDALQIRQVQSSHF